MQTPSVERVAFSIAEVSSLTGLGKTKLYELIGSGALASKKIGRRRLVLSSELNRFLSSSDEARG